MRLVLFPTENPQWERSVRPRIWPEVRRLLVAFDLPEEAVHEAIVEEQFDEGLA